MKSHCFIVVFHFWNIWLSTLHANVCSAEASIFRREKLSNSDKSNLFIQRPFEKQQNRLSNATGNTTWVKISRKKYCVWFLYRYESVNNQIILISFNITRSLGTKHYYLLNISATVANAIQKEADFFFFFVDRIITLNWKLDLCGRALSPRTTTRTIGYCILSSCFDGFSYANKQNVRHSS